MEPGDLESAASEARGHARELSPPSSSQCWPLYWATAVNHCIALHTAALNLLAQHQLAWFDWFSTTRRTIDSFWLAAHRAPAHEPRIERRVKAVVIPFPDRRRPPA